jgi:hypothetical protein
MRRRRKFVRLSVQIGALCALALVLAWSVGLQRKRVVRSSARRDVRAVNLNGTSFGRALGSDVSVLSNSDTREDVGVHPTEKPSSLADFLEWQNQIADRERKVFSQNGEDGVIEHIFGSIGVTDKYFVEFGVENGDECNTRYIAEKLSWTGVRLDGGHDIPNRNIHKERVYPGNIIKLFEKYKVPKQFDLLSVDIDTYDLWVWRALLKGGYRPRVVVIEFNRNFQRGCFATFPDPTGSTPRVWWPIEDQVMGASLDALDLLARQYGYVLIYTDKATVNAFFIRKDVLPEGAMDALEYERLHPGAIPLHKPPTEDRVQSLVNYLEWSRVYHRDNPRAAQRLKHPDPPVSTCNRLGAFLPTEWGENGEPKGGDNVIRNSRYRPSRKLRKR